MKYFIKGSLWLMTILSLPLLPLVGVADEIECDNRGPRITAVKLDAPVSNAVDFSGSNGGLDTVPLLQTEIHVSGDKNSCVIAHFSAEFNTTDNLIVFQASIDDDDPMEGHTVFPQELRDPLPPLTTPIVFDRSSISASGNHIPAMAAYNFFKIVGPGSHTVKIKWAGCCSANNSGGSAKVLAAVLTLEYKGKPVKDDED